VSEIQCGLVAILNRTDCRICHLCSLWVQSRVVHLELSFAAACASGTETWQPTASRISMSVSRKFSLLFFTRNGTGKRMSWAGTPGGRCLTCPKGASRQSLMTALMPGSTLTLACEMKPLTLCVELWRRWTSLPTGMTRISRSSWLWRSGRPRWSDVRLNIMYIQIKYYLFSYLKSILLFIYWSVEHGLHVHKSTSSITRLQNTHSCLLKHKKHETIN